MLDLYRLYHPDGKTLGTAISGLSGSGKTTIVISTLQNAIQSNEFGEYHRFIIIDPKTQKGDYDLLSEPITDLNKAFKSIRKERVTLFWPNVEEFGSDVSDIVDYIFALADKEEKTSFTLVIDEASILITPTKIPPSLKRLSVQGRAKRIKPVFIGQRPIFNRWLDANLSNLILAKTLPVDFDVLQKRWGVDFEQYQESLAEVDYSFMFFDLEKVTVKMMKPVPLPKVPKPRKKRTWMDKFFTN